MDGRQGYVDVVFKWPADDLGRKTADDTLQCLGEREYKVRSEMHTLLNARRWL